jgi:hypothetical protein
MEDCPENPTHLAVVVAGSGSRPGAGWRPPFAGSPIDSILWCPASCFQLDVARGSGRVFLGGEARRSMMVCVSRCFCCCRIGRLDWEGVQTARSDRLGRQAIVLGRGRLRTARVKAGMRPRPGPMGLMRVAIVSSLVQLARRPARPETMNTFRVCVGGGRRQVALAARRKRQNLGPAGLANRLRRAQRRRTPVHWRPPAVGAHGSGRKMLIAAIVKRRREREREQERGREEGRPNCVMASRLAAEWPPHTWKCFRCMEMMPIMTSTGGTN